MADRQRALADTPAELDELIGLRGPDERITLWRKEIQIDEIHGARGEEALSTHEYQMVLDGPPGTAKTSFARIEAEFLFGLGEMERPTVIEVTEADLVDGYLSQTTARIRRYANPRRAVGFSSTPALRPAPGCSPDERGDGPGRAAPGRAHRGRRAR